MAATSRSVPTGLTMPLPGVATVTHARTKKWTGKSIGRQVILDSTDAYRRFRAGERAIVIDRSSLLNHECLQEDRHRRPFFAYINLNNWMERNRERCESHMQQCQSRHRELTHYLSTIVIAEDVYRYVAKTRENLPDDTDLALLDGFMENEEPCVLRTDLGTMGNRYLESIAKAYDLFGQSYYFVDGYNYALGRIAELHKLPDVMVYRKPIELLDGEISLVNDWIDTLDRRLNFDGYPSQELREMKLMCRKCCLPHILVEAILAPRKQYEKEIDRLIKSFAGFGEPIGGSGPEADRLMRILLYRPEPYRPTED